MNDVRWTKRFRNFTRALAIVRSAVDLAQQRELTELEQLGLIRCFEFTHELAWNVLKDYLEEQGFVGIIGPKNATREAFKNDLIVDGEAWMDMIKARNLTTHAYDTAVATPISDDILSRFFPQFDDMEKTFGQRVKEEAGDA